MNWNEIKEIISMIKKVIKEARQENNLTQSEMMEIGYLTLIKKGYNDEFSQDVISLIFEKMYGTHFRSKWEANSPFAEMYTEAREGLIGKLF